MATVGLASPADRTSFRHRRCESAPVSTSSIYTHTHPSLYDTSLCAIYVQCVYLTGRGSGEEASAAAYARHFAAEGAFVLHLLRTAAPQGAGGDAGYLGLPQVVAAPPASPGGVFATMDTRNRCIYMAYLT